MDEVHYGFEKKHIDSQEEGDVLFQRILTKFIVWGDLNITRGGDRGLRRPVREVATKKLGFGGSVEWETGFFNLVIERDHFESGKGTGITNSDMVICFRAEVSRSIKDEEKKQKLKEKAREFIVIIDKLLVQEGIAIPLRYNHEE
jgi:hypothetical protein